MKKFTKSLMLVAASAMAFSANGEATWEYNVNANNFIGAQGGRGIMADFNNDGWIDIYYSGAAADPMYNNKPGIWGWQSSSNMLWNNGDGSWTMDIIGVEGTGEYELDENGEPIVNDDGTLREYHRLIDPKHGILAGSHGHYATIDYNNDGLVDLLVLSRRDGNDWAGYFDRAPEHMKAAIWDGTQFSMVLYQNMGNGQFEIDVDCNLPVAIADRDDGRGMFFNTLSWGDYDRDGYVDVFINGNVPQSQPGEPGRIVQLWRNIDGTGRFEQMNIAETKGGTWTNEVKETDPETGEEVVVIPSRELEGWFLLVAGNGTMADINNDGWLDIVIDGWADRVNDGIYEGGSNGRVYLNSDNGEGGRKFVDITSPSGGFYLTRAGQTQLVDLTGDGYLDLLNGGYGDHGLGWKTLMFFNNLGDDPTIEPEGIYDFSDSMDQYGLPNEECMSLVIRDFDGDEILDMMYVSKQDGAVFYGDMGGNYTRSTNFPMRGFNCSDGFEATGDVTNDGLIDRFITGWLWMSDNAEMDGKNYREITGNGGDWAWGKYLWHNTTDVEVLAPEAPTDVEAIVDTEAGTITVNWTDAEGVNLAYNVVVMTPSGKVIANLPVDPVTGFIKVTENKNIAVRPMVQTYTLPYYEFGEYKVGVQAVSLNSEKSSPITWGANVSSVGNIAADLSETTVKVTVNGDEVLVNADATADVQIVDMLGRTVATGVTNAPINVAADGVLVVTVNGKSVKVVK